LEATQLAGFDEVEARRIFGQPRGWDELELGDIRLQPWQPADAKARFLERFAALYP